MTARERVVAVVPAKDRCDTVAATVGALRALPAVSDVLVVDDGSADDTAAAARAAGAWVLRLAENRGKGGAVAAAVAATPETDVYLLVDADVGSTAGEAAALLAPVLAGDADMTVGVLPSAGGRGGFGLVRRLAQAGIRAGTGGVVPEAPLSGQRAVRGQLLRALPLAPRFGLETALTLDARRAGARVVEVPVAMDHRHTGRRWSGFAHRARQGADIVRALWPRLTSRPARRALVALGLVTALAAAAWSGSRWAPSSVPATAPAAKVLLVGVPGLAWDDIGTGAMPNLDRLTGTGAVAAMTVRTKSDRPSVGEGYASLGAGSRVRAGPAADGAVDDDGRVVLPAAAEVRRRAGAHLATLPGALGDALHAAGRRTAVVGNADLAPGLTGPTPVGQPAVARPAATALMDRSGVVDAGTVAPGDLLTTDRPAPFGHRADPDAMVARARAALDAADVVLVDSGDLDRYAAVVELGPTPAFAAATRARALAATDELLGRLTADVPPGTLVLVVSVVPPGDEWRLTPVVAWGAGVRHGYLHSTATKRLGLVTLTDVAPTVLAAVGAPVPDEMPGAVLRYRPGRPSLARLATLDRDAAYRERVYLPVAIGFVVLALAVFALVGLALDGSSRVPRPVVRVLVLAVAAFPLATLGFRAIPGVAALGRAGPVLLVALGAAVVALVSRARRHPLSPLAWLFGCTAAVLVLDVATGARLQVAGILGYSPHTAYRFFGLGNTAFAVLAACGVLAAALHVGHAPRRDDAVATAAAFLVLVAVVDGAPSLGNDVGGILTLVPVFALTVVAFARRRLSWRAVALAAGGALAVVGLAAALDLSRAPASRTHLGRLAAATLHHGKGSLLTTVARKASVNLDNLRSVPWAVAVLVVAALLLWLAATAKGGFGRILPAGSAARTGVVAALAAGLLGFVVNDSGVIVTLMVLVEVAPLLALAALAPGPGGSVLLEPAPDATAAGRAARAPASQP